MKPLRNNCLNAIVVTTIFIATLLFGLYRSQFGLSYTDEGYYLATAMRIALGDVPFRDEIINPQRMIDIALAPVFIIFPDVTVYQLRCGNVIIEVLAAMFLFLTLRRYAPPVPLALACGLSVFVMNLSWLPNYHNLPVTFAISAWCCWVLALQQERTAPALALAVLSGAILFVAAIIYIPLLIVLVFAFAPIVFGADRRNRLFVVALAQVSTVAGLFGIGFLILLSRGLVEDYFYATIAITSPTHYALGLSQKLSIFWQSIWPDLSVTVAAAGVAYWFSALFARKRTPAASLLVAFGGFLAGAILVLIVAEPSSRFELQNSPFHARYLRVTLMCFGLHCGVMLRSAMYPPQEGNQSLWRDMYASALTLSVLLAFVYSFLSVGAFKIMYLVPLVFPLSIAAISHQVTSRNDTSAMMGTRAVALFLFVVPFAYITYCLPWQYVMKEKYVRHQTTPFTSPGLAGIKTLPADAKSLDALTAFLKGKVARGDFLLAYHHLPIVYYVTGTRPALDRAWSSSTNPLWDAYNSLEYMIQEKRVPRYCVRLVRAGEIYSRDPRMDPVNALVEQHYEKIATVQYTQLEPFCEVFELRNDSPMQQMMRDDQQ